MIPARPLGSLWNQTLDKMTEIAQPLPTHFNVARNLLSRIDRIYSNAATCELLDRRPRVATIGLITTTTSPSDHVPVSVVLGSPARAPPPHPTMPSWIAKHRFFPAEVARLWRTAKHISAQNTSLICSMQL